MITQQAFGLIFISLGAFLLWLVWRKAQAVKASRLWPSVSGRVISASPHPPHSAAHQSQACRSRLAPGGSIATGSFSRKRLIRLGPMAWREWA